MFDRDQLHLKHEAEGFMSPSATKLVEGEVS